eukprot:Lithocolla_globosa_v1_NODE_6216_length_1121_cov_10.208255.p1 type:complete len:320 gc:universal NODE_6216_length_1121_cov_10.208255:976-17(-)
MRRSSGYIKCVFNIFKDRLQYKMLQQPDKLKKISQHLKNKLNLKQPLEFYTEPLYFDYPRLCEGKEPIIWRDGPVAAFRPVKLWRNGVTWPVFFPPPNNININMLPFVMNDVKSLPEELRHYWNLVARCHLSDIEAGKVGYLTIHEGLVGESVTQRRPGIHVDAHPVQTVFGRGQVVSPRAWMDLHSPQLHSLSHWGTGYLLHNNMQGGIYMASNVPYSTRVYPTTIRQDCTDQVGSHGDLEHFRWCLGKGYHLPANVMVWMTDRTPHESLPMSKPTYRQYFRLVTSDVGMWYEDHSTKNRLGIVPPEHVKIVKGDKFS